MDMLVKLTALERADFNLDHMETVTTRFIKTPRSCFGASNVCVEKRFFQDEWNQPYLMRQPLLYATSPANVGSHESSIFNPSRSCSWP